MAPRSVTRCVPLIEKQGMTPAPSTPAEFKKFVQDSIAIIQRAATLAAIPKVDDWIETRTLYFSQANYFLTSDGLGLSL